MTARRVHVTWAVVMILVTGGWGRWCASRRETGAAPSERQARPSGPELQEVGSPLRGSERSALAPARAVPGPGVGRVLPEYSYDRPSPEEIRRLIRSDARADLARACSAIALLSDRELRKELLLELSTCKDFSARQECLRLLSNFDDPECTARFREALENDSDSWIRSLAAGELGKRGGEGAVDLLLKFARDGDLRLRTSVAASLNQLGQPGAAAELIPILAAGLDDPDGAVRREAVERLSELKTALALPELVRATRDRSGDVRRSAANGLEDLQSPEAIPVLEGLLGDPVSDVVDTARGALKRLRDAEK